MTKRFNQFAAKEKEYLTELNKLESDEVKMRYAMPFEELEHL